jgi:type III pantothenate kinase
VVSDAGALLVVDVGNTNTALGLYEGRTLARHWRLTTHRESTTDEIGLSVRGLLQSARVDEASLGGVAIASVVPPLRFSLRQAFRQYFDRDPIFIEPGIKTGMPILYENPQEVGADRIVNAVAAYDAYGGPCIVVDFGTATTFDVITARGEYAGGVIVPGVQISAEALFEHAARLSRVDIRKPETVVGRTTAASIQSGLFYGYLSLVEGLIDRIGAELSESPRVIATGGLAELIGRGTAKIHEIDPLLTLTGLRILWEKNARA